MKIGNLILMLVACTALFTLALLGCESSTLDGDDDGAFGEDDWGAPDGDTDADSDGDGDSVVPPEEEPEVDTDSEPCDTENAVTLYLSADDSNSMASPVIARSLIQTGIHVNRPIRTYEFLNYYSFDYEAADPGSVRVTAQLRANEEPVDETLDATYNLQIGVRAPDVDSADRRPLNLTLSLDCSGSMGGTPIALVRASCNAIAGSLAAGDVISMVTWDTVQNILLEPHVVSGPDDSDVVDACNSLSASGGTDLHSGLVTAYELAQENFGEDRINRVILMSDGGANVGITDAELIAENADDSEGEGIYLMGVGMGSPDGYNDGLMDVVTDEGKGAYIYIDSATEAEKMFGERFLANVEVAARDVRVELALPPTFEMVEFHGEEYSENPAEVEPQHLAPNDAMIYHQIIGSCDSSVLTLDDPITITAEYFHPFTLAPQSDALETTLGDLLGGSNALLLKGDAVVAYAEALKELRELSGAPALALIDDTIATVEAAQAALAGDPDLIEIADLLATYRTYFD